MFAAISLLQIFPNTPNSFLGWVAILVVPVPCTLVIEWLLERITNARIPFMDSLGQSIEGSPHRLLFTIILIAGAGACGLSVVWLLSRIP